MKKIFLSEKGILPNTDITAALCELFSKEKNDTEFIFESGDYYFSPQNALKLDYNLSNTEHIPYRTLGILLKDMKNCVINGNGARLWFEGQMQPFTLDCCENLTVRGFSINWRYPLVAEAVVLSHTEMSATLYIDPQMFPHRYSDVWLEFYVGAGEWYPMFTHHQIYDDESRCILQDTGDRFRVLSVSETGAGDGIFRFDLKRKVDIKDGSIVVLRHNARVHSGIFAEKCRELVFEDINIYSCGGIGCLAQFCHDLTYRRINFLPDSSLGRAISSGRDDGIHLTSNSGTLTVTESTFFGLMDDPINVHGCCVMAKELISDSSVRCRYGHDDANNFRYWAEKGDEVVFINKKNMAPVAKARVASYELESPECFVLELDSHIDDKVKALISEDGIAVDNLSHTAEFICTKNRFGNCRARGILVSVPKRVLIEDNYFETSGSAILMAGDSNYWYESGACRNVEIRNNIFTSKCLSAVFQFGEGVISICPTIPEPDISLPYHENVYIHDNIFDTADTTVLYAFSCDSLEFSGNRIFKSPSRKWWNRRDALVSLDTCRNARVVGNDVIGSFELRGLDAKDCVDVESDM